MTNPLSLRKASIADRAFLLSLRKLTMTEHLATANIYMDDVKHLDRIDEFFEDSLIVEYKAQPIGLIKLAHLPDRLHIRQLQIMPKFQGKGVGGKILQRIFKRANQLNLPVSLNVLKKNPALHLYQRHGFEINKETELEYYMLVKNT